MLQLNSLLKTRTCRHQPGSL